MGQARLKEALLAVATDDGLDGLLVTGEKGTAKSTLVRGLADLLPDQRAVADCPYGCPPDDRARQCADCRDRAALPVEERPVPLVTLPLGATRERVVGTLSVSDALAGEAEFDPGLLARANRGVLYVDEVNLLDDHLVDVLLDAAASGENSVERDGVSVAHPAEFTLVGTMNPEEGDLRPQLRDRFALSVEVRGERDLEDRVAIIDGALAGPEDPADGPTDDTPETDGTADYRRRLREGRDLLESVELTADQKREVAELCLEAGVDGHRADIATARAARALAALEGRPTVTDGDLRRAAEYALGHRMRSAPFEDAPDAEEVVEEHFEDEAADSDGDRGDASEGATDQEGSEEPGEPEQSAATEDAGPESDGPPDADGEPGADPEPDGAAGAEDDASDDGGAETDPDPGPEPRPGADAEATDGGGATGPGDEDDDADEEATPLVPGQPRQDPGTAVAPDLRDPKTDASGRTGRAGAAPSTANRGARVRTESTDGGSGVDAAASVRSAATRGSARVERRDLRQSVRAGDGEALVVFAVDASASMRPAMRTAKGVTLELLEDAYTERDRVAVVAFAGEDAEVLLPPTDSVQLAARHLKDLPTGDRTPLPAGLRSAAAVVDRADPGAAVVVLVTDGRANAGAQPTADTRAAAEALDATGARVVCVDAGAERGLLTEVVRATDGQRVPLEDLTPERVEHAVATARR